MTSPTASWVAIVRLSVVVTPIRSAAKPSAATTNQPPTPSISHHHLPGTTATSLHDRVAVAQIVAASRPGTISASDTASGLSCPAASRPRIATCTAIPAPTITATTNPLLITRLLSETNVVRRAMAGST